MKLFTKDAQIDENEKGKAYPEISFSFSVNLMDVREHILEFYPNTDVLAEYGDMDKVSSIAASYNDKTLSTISEKLNEDLEPYKNRHSGNASRDLVIKAEEIDGHEKDHYAPINDFMTDVAAFIQERLSNSKTLYMQLKHGGKKEYFEYKEREFVSVPESDLGKTWNQLREESSIDVTAGSNRSKAKKSPKPR